MESAENREQSPKANQKEESNDSQSLSKIETIRLINDSIDQLESTIKEISKNSAKELPSSDSIKTLLNTAQELADSVAPPSTPEMITKEAPPKEKPVIPATEVEPVVTKSNVKTDDKSIEVKAIPAADIKSKPPVNSQSKQKPDKPDDKTIAKAEKNENRGLAIIGISAIAIAVIALFWLYFPQIKTAIFSTSEMAETTEIVVDRQIQPDTETNDIPVANPDENIDLDTNTDTEEEFVRDPQVIASEPETIAPVAIPQDLTSPGKTKNLKIETIEPELTFTPEQTLIAALQTKLAEITENYDSDLFKNIKVDLPQASLLIEVTNNWYELDESRQNNLANKILQRSRQLNFSKLKFQDSTGTLVARNPVVGDRIIIVESSKEY